jgi:hypothetical protein
MNPARYLMKGNVVELNGDGEVFDDLYNIDFMPVRK